MLKMVMIYPVLSTILCVLTKWTRHLGFCITYTALLMKTWRYVYIGTSIQIVRHELLLPG